MEDKDILQRIVSNGGSCNWLNNEPDGGESTCAKCPLNNLLKDEDGNYVSCFLAVKAHQTEDQDAAYYKKAVEVLIDLAMEEELAKCT